MPMEGQRITTALPAFPAGMLSRPKRGRSLGPNQNGVALNKLLPPKQFLRQRLGILVPSHRLGMQDELPYLKEQKQPIANTSFR
jgi:hypothetical protein